MRALLVATLVVSTALLAPAGPAPAEETAPPGATPAVEAPPSGTAATEPAHEDEARPTLTGDSTLAEWTKATAAERSRVAVALAKNRLEPTATKLEIAKTAMEITGCVSSTARDARFAAWKVAPTAATCLTAPEKPSK